MAKKHAINAATFGGQPFYGLFLQGRGGQACHAIKTKAWLKVTRGFIPKRDTMAHIQVCGH